MSDVKGPIAMPKSEAVLIGFPEENVEGLQGIVDGVCAAFGMTVRQVIYADDFANARAEVTGEPEPDFGSRLSEPGAVTIKHEDGASTIVISKESDIPLLTALLHELSHARDHAHGLDRGLPIDPCGRIAGRALAEYRADINSISWMGHLIRVGLVTLRDDAGNAIEVDIPQFMYPYYGGFAGVVAQLGARLSDIETQYAVGSLHYDDVPVVTYNALAESLFAFAHLVAVDSAAARLMHLVGTDAADPFLGRSAALADAFGCRDEDGIAALVRGIAHDVRAESFGLFELTMPD